MTEAQWLASTDLLVLSGYAHARGWTRKVRLFSCACCRFANRIHQDEWVDKAVGRAESYADGKLEPSTMERWRREAEKRWNAASRLRPFPAVAGLYLAVRDACEPTVDGHYFWSGKRLSSRP